MVREPKVFLLDEPLSNLDAKMRTQMRSEITKLHKKLQTTFVYVTHDQVEAMTMGNKIVVMKDGIVQQVDTPNNLYIKPANKFVASFIGTPQIVFFTVKIIKENGKLYFKLNDSKQLKIDESIAKIIPENYIDKEVYMGIRAEDTHDDNDLINKNPEKTLKGKISLVERLGNETLVYVNMDDVEGEDLVIRVGTRSHYDINQEIEFMVDTSHVYLFDMETELAILY